MSICSFKGFNVRFCRQAFILAHSSRVPLLLPPGVGSTRRTHNSLYQMVKKRALEARTKLQANKFPHNQPCMSNNSASQNSASQPCSISASKSTQSSENCEPDSESTTSSQSQTSSPCLPPLSNAPPECSQSNQSSETLATQCAAKVIRTETACKTNIKSYPTTPSCPTPLNSQSSECEEKKGEPKKLKKCQNTHVLTAANCNTKVQKGGYGGTGKSKRLTENQKIAIGILAALGAGGLLYWLLVRAKKKDHSPIVLLPDDPLYEYHPTYPEHSSDLPKHVPYILIGGGTAAFSAFRAIKSNDARAKVLMITNEFRKPYMRPPLSKELWYSAENVEPTKDYRFKQWTGSERSLFFEPDQFFVDPTKLMETANGGIAVAQGFNVRKIDPTNHIVTLNDGYEIGYDECLIATGCSPRSLEVLNDAPPGVKERIMMYRTPDDFERLKYYANEKKSIMIVGNGFTGSELACSLANYCKDRKVKIYQVFPESGVMSKVLPDYLSKWTTRKVEDQGVCVLTNAAVQEVKRDNETLQVTLNNGSTVSSDVMVVCVGCDPNTTIADLSGLEVDGSHGGFVVNAELEARTNLFVAGDACCFYDPLLGRRRVEHHDHSVVSGRLAGENMVGKKKSYTHQSMFWSDLGPEIGYEGIGLVDASLPTVGVFALPSKVDRNTDNLTELREQEENLKELPDKDLPDVKCDDCNDEDSYGRGVIFYMKNDKIVGILLWNLFNRIGLARTIINQNKKYDDLNEVAKLFEIHS